MRVGGGGEGGAFGARAWVGVLCFPVCLSIVDVLNLSGSTIEHILLIMVFCRGVIVCVLLGSCIDWADAQCR